MSLLRSTKFVRYFTGAARTLILNSAKTAEANLLINPKALCPTNNVLMRDYATSKKNESLEPLLQRLDSEVRRFGRISKRDIDEVFDEIKSKNDITSSQSLLVIRCCGELVPEELPEQRTLLVQKIWSVLTERGIPMDISHYNALLRVYIENEHPFSPAKFLEELETKGLEPNRVTYQRLMWRYCQEGDVEGATKVLERMRELSLPVSEPVLNALVMGHAFHGDTENAKAVLETMAGAGLEPTSRTHTLLACGYAKKGDVEGVENIIKMAGGKDILLSDKDLLDIIEHMAIGGHADKVETLFPHLRKGIGYNQDVYNLILRLINKGFEDTAKKVMKTMEKTKAFEDTMFKGAFFVKQLLRLNKSPESLIQTCKELKQEGLVPNALYIATEASLVQGQTELAERLFKELQAEGYPVRQHYYWPLLAQKGREGDEEGLLQIVRNMGAEALSPTGEALRDYVIPHLIAKDSPLNVITKLQIANVPAIHSARNVMIYLLETGKITEAAEIALQYRPRGQFSLLSRPLINAFSKTKNVNAFVTVLHVSSSSAPSQTEDENQDDVQKDSNIVNEVGRIVKAAIKNVSQPELQEKLLKAVLAKGLRINTESAEAIEQYIGKNMTTQLSEILSQLTSTDLELAPIENVRRTGENTSASLEKLLARIVSKGGTNVTRIQKQLLLLYIQEDKVDKVDSYINELRSSNFELTPATLAQLYEFYCNNDKIEKALEIEAELRAKEPEFVLNKFKIIGMAYALVRANRTDEAIAFLIENKGKGDKTSSNFMINSKSWQMLNTLAERKDIENVKLMTKTLIDNGYIEPSNILLGPSIKVHLLNEDIDGGLKEFENCCKQYRSTPWKGELMKALILKEDATKLQWLADISTQIHGEVNILHDLVLAFIECGRLRQARRILETPGLQTRQRRIDNACQRYVEEGKSEYLEGLLEATKELSHIDRANIFYHLLVTYCKADETDKALGLWTILQEEDEVPSDQFLLYLGQHLKSKRRNVPFIIPNEDFTPKTQAVQQENKETKQSGNKKGISSRVEELCQKGQNTQAYNVALKSIENNNYPKTTVLKFLLKNLALEGKADKIMALEQYFNDSLKKNVTYDDKLTLALFVNGSGAQHVDKLLTSIESAHSAEEIQAVLVKFPRSLALASAVKDDDLAQKCHKIAEIAATKGFAMPANLLWMEYLLCGKEDEANALWNKCLSNQNVVVFRRLLQESHERNAPELIEKLIDLLKTNKMISCASIGNAASRLINMYVLNDNPEKAIEAFNKAVQHGVLKEHFTKNALERLEAVCSSQGKELKF